MAPQSIALCWSEGRTEKDRAIRQNQELRFLADTEKIAKRVALGRLKSVAKIYEAIGRLKERSACSGYQNASWLQSSDGPKIVTWMRLPTRMKSTSDPKKKKSG
jgi:hypothetical protein